MATLHPVLRGTRGLHTTYDPVRIGSSSAIPYLAEAVNVDIDESGRISRCKGWTATARTEAAHSIFASGDTGLYVSGSSLYRLNPDYTRLLLRSDLTPGATMSYAAAGDTIFFSNDFETGKYENGAAAAWAVGGYVGPTTNRSFSSPFSGRHHTIYGGRMYYAIGSLLFYTEPFGYSMVDISSNFIPFEGSIRMVKPVGNGLYVGTDRGTFFLAGGGPEDFALMTVDYDKVLEYSAVQIDGSEMGLPGILVIWANSRGICMGASGGEVKIITEERLSFPSFDRGYGFYANGRYLLNIDRGYSSYLTIRANLKYQFNDRSGRIGAISQQSGLTFNSACFFNGVWLGAGASGIAQLDTGSMYGTAAISAYIKTHTTDFGNYRNKHMRKVVVAGEGDGAMQLTTYNKEGNARTYDFAFAGSLQDSVKVPVGRDGLSRYWSFKIANVAGADFSIDSIDALEITT